LAKQNELLTRIKDKQDTFCTVSQGVLETTIIVSKNVEETVEEIFGDEKRISNFRNLSSITIKLPKETVDTPGAYYTILALLAWEGINVVEVVSTYTELTVIFRDEDVDKAFSTLKRAFRT
jgi:aspartokinase